MCNSVTGEAFPKLQFWDRRSIDVLYQFVIKYNKGNFMNITRNREGEKLVLSLEGRLDTVTAPMLQERLIFEFDQNKHIRLDFTQLAYVSSAGLRVLLVGAKTAKAAGGTMVLSNVSKEIKEILEMTGFTGILTFE
jgi:anti-anti-sigma factor